MQHLNTNKDKEQQFNPTGNGRALKNKDISS